MPPGEHYISIRVDNRLKLTPYGNAHIYSEDNQTNWNGIIGKMFLEASSKTYISDLQVYPDIDKRKIDIKMEIDNQLKINEVNIELMVERTTHGKTKELTPWKIIKTCEPVIRLEYHLSDDCLLWDEYKQPLYRLTALISGDTFKDSKTAVFGMRKFSAKETQFTINGRVTFLRGKHDACVFPLTGHPPMDAEGWIRVFRIAKSYGINHYRFHSYCPPEAAFTAADQEGIYLQAELPFWGGLESDSVAAMLREEGLGMLKSYANHPSFVLFSHGNEIWSGHDRVEKNIIAFKEFDSRPLYTMGSNNNIGYVGPGECSDLFVAARTPYTHDTTLTHIRLTHAFVDSRDGGILNTQTPSTEVNFSYPVSQIKIPIIAHETGQYQIFPDYKEISKYTGVLRAWNLELFQRRLQNAGMADQQVDFQKASGAWSALCYKAEMEAAIRTRGLGGFQLLDLQDFPGQGTALVGILDAFMDSKNVISPQEWRQSCDDVILLLEFPKYCWTNNENFHAKVKAANYSGKSLNTELKWEIMNSVGDILHTEIFPNAIVDNGYVHLSGEINFLLSAIKKAEKLTVNLSAENGHYTNSYPVWIYPASETGQDVKDIIVTNKLTVAIFNRLEQGAKVLLFPKAEDVRSNSLPGLFPPDFWNYGMFKGISEWAKKPISPGTLGILTDPDHAIFNVFPTDFHTNWQWFSITRASHSLILDSTPRKYRPIVQVIDNLERNHKLGLIFEFRSGRGKLLICMSRLDQMPEKPEAFQLYKSLINYMNSADFNPQCEQTRTELNRLFNNQMN
ncbi:MAG: hypothetical protein JXB44_09800 [Calditrichaceae bacterium]|nr:hypothetical protein [Calditrichaceae bacterium]RQV94479.1 MAG: beta-galactosidase [Calditrichota bacterium]